MKRIAILALGLLPLGLVACGTTEETPAPDTTETTADTPSDTALPADLQTVTLAISGMT